MDNSAWHMSDLSENLFRMTGILSALLFDHTTNHNIVWMTTQYSGLGEGYKESDTIKVRFISGVNNGVVKPRIDKPIEEQEYRSRKRGEVFTPSWVCNQQNNQVDSCWFGTVSPFSIEIEHGWRTTDRAIQFPCGKTWREYVQELRLEVSCGEAPYLTSRYDTVTGKYIPVKDRIGLLDRKLRVVTENCGTPAEWKEWATIALKSVYGYDWQGDNVLLARENLLCAVVESYMDAFAVPPAKDDLLSWTHVISWNLWQMDGIKCVVPESCVDFKMVETLLGVEKYPCKCVGCVTNNAFEHNGRYCVIMDWKRHKAVRFVDLMRR